MPNRLENETSPYLRQHADNPVDWWPWGNEALQEAAARDVPILISVGYSACHWCHVMAHESFEDPAIGQLMNDLFVNVKVDREERPDVDAVYMDAVLAMNGNGGWPMTVFCLPDGRPFFAGTYFPKTSAGGRMGFPELCQRINELWHTRRPELEEQAAAITEAIDKGIQLPQEPASPREEFLQNAVSTLRSQIDKKDGGFGRAPKFPQTFAIDVLLRHAQRTGDENVLADAMLCLDAMAAGGIYDHLGGGFARYSTDSKWLVPHFEKMLYDQALLARVYLHAWQLTGEERYLQTLSETIHYVLRDLTHSAGGFYSAEDADSEGVEGKFYVWTAEEIRSICGDDAQAVLDWYGVTENGNWEGNTILERPVRDSLLRPDAVERGRQALWAAREKRIRPSLDDKVLTEWNALMLATLTEAAAATGNTEWLDAAIKNGNFLCENLRVNGRWMRSWQGTARIEAFSADYAALVDAFVRLYEATGDHRWLNEATQCADDLIRLFADTDDFGFFTSGNDVDQLIARPKEFMDNATACSNSLAAVGLLRLSLLTENENYAHHANVLVSKFTESAARVPLGFGHFLLAAEMSILGSVEIVISGDRPDMVSLAQKAWVPAGVLSYGEPLPIALWEGRHESGADGKAYVCRNSVCGLPATDADQLRDQLQQISPSATVQ
ncbi:MAG: hypothetical protein RLZZ31_568 [Actinomycetota bacterium]